MYTVQAELPSHFTVAYSKMYLYTVKGELTKFFYFCFLEIKYH